MAIFYVWGFRPPAPHVLGNATRVANIADHENANLAALESGFDVESFTNAGTPAWATAYVTAGDEPFEPGSGVDVVAGFIAADRLDAARRSERWRDVPPWER